MAKLSSTSVQGSLFVDGNTTINGSLNVDGEILNKATTTTQGVVQLNDNTDSTSTTQAATANAVRKVEVAKLSKSGGTMTGPIDMAAQNIYLTGADPGDIVWRNASLSQIGRVWYSGGLLLTGGSSTSNPVTIDSSNNLILPATLKHASKTAISGDGSTLNIGGVDRLLKLNSNANPQVNVSGTNYTLYHSGNLPDFAGDLNNELTLITGDGTSVTTQNWDTLTGNKFYDIKNHSGSNKPSATVNNATVAASTSGILLSYEHLEAKNQLYLTHTNSEIWVRGGRKNGTWAKWAKVYTTEHKPHWEDLIGKPSDFTPANHQHEYGMKIGDTEKWMRFKEDASHIKVYGNSRQMVFRTDGTTEYSSGVGAYPFAWMYGGNASSNRLAHITSTGDLWTKAAGSLSSKVPSSTGSSITIHADSDSSSTSEYLLLKAGHNELKVSSSAGGSTVTKANDRITYNGNVVWHAGNFNPENKADKSLMRNTYKQFTVGGDANKYYPVVIAVGKSQGFPYTKVNISRQYSWAAPDTWNTATHRGGLTLSFMWNSDCYWGGNGSNFEILDFSETYCTMVAGLSKSVEGYVVWLRGGNALYQLDTEYGTAATATVKLEGFTDGAKLNFPIRTNVDNVNSEIKNYYISRNGYVFDRNQRVYSPNNKPAVADVSDLKLKFVDSATTVNNPVQTWANSSIKNNSIIFGGDYGSHSTTDGNIVFSSSKGAINIVIDGEFYAKEGQYKVYHPGNKPSAADVGALALAGGTISGNVTFNNNAYVSNQITCNTINTKNNGGVSGSKTDGSITWLSYVDTSNNVCLGHTSTKTKIQSSANPIVQVGSSQYTMYHTGNEPVNGYLKSKSLDSNLDNQSGVGIFAWGNTTTGRPTDYGSVLQWGNGASITPGSNQSWVSQLASGTNNLLYFRTRTNTGAWNGWGQIYTSVNKPTPSAIGAAQRLVNKNGYDGMVTNDGGDSNWVRTTQNGIIPYQSGGHGSIGTSSWRFSNGYINQMYGNSEQWGNRKCWWGAVGSRPGGGYIQFCW